MMQVMFESRPDLFLQQVGGHLLPFQAEHNLILSMCEAAQKRLAKGQPAAISLMRFYNDAGYVMSGAQVPGMNLVLSRAQDVDFSALVDTLVRLQASFPGVVGPSNVASSFINDWQKATQTEAYEYMDQIIYALTAVTPVRATEGKMRPAALSEHAVIADWMRAFAKETLPKTEHMDGTAAEKRAAEMIADGRAYVWDVKGQPVSLATSGGTAAAARIGSVFTPEKFRGQGYASAIVAALSQKKLHDGAKLCCLYADARNTVSNSIYRKIGYEFTGRSSYYVLKAAA
jgi:hypothetical protein